MCTISGNGQEPGDAVLDQDSAESIQLFSGSAFAAQTNLHAESSDESLFKMRRVDWRWAAAKGFLNKETNQWNEAMGGKEAYIIQRNERILARFGHFP
jgi:hypothetical protein